MNNKLYRKAVFVVVYRNIQGKREYLLLHRHKHWRGWEFPKGGVEDKESLVGAVKREVKEETGLKALKVEKYMVHGKYDYRRKFRDRPKYVGQTYWLFSSEVKEGKVKIDKREHFGFKWMNFQEARKKLTYRNQKRCLGIVNKSLKKF